MKALQASAHRAPRNINLDTNQQTSRPRSLEHITQTVWVDEQWEFYGIHIRTMIVEIQECTNKFTILLYILIVKFYTAIYCIRWCILRFVQCLFWWVHFFLGAALQWQRELYGLSPVIRYEFRSHRKGTNPAPHEK